MMGRLMTLGGSYRKSRAFVSYVTWPRALRYEPARMVSSFAELVSRVVEMVTVARSWVRVLEKRIKVTG